jgi:cation diffusion facilitator CzcD-associated flavoprotein CzcO
MRHVADKYDIRKHMRFGEEVAEAHFDGSMWQLRTKRGTTDTVNAIVACCGYLHIPLYPKLSGLENFKGPTFHSARWPEQFDFSNKRVGLIGNGSTGVQIASVMGEDGIDMTVFQRSPQWVFPLPNREIGPKERKLVKLIPWIGKVSGAFYQWFFEKIFARAVIREGWQRKFLSGMCRVNLKRVKNPELRKALTPDYKPLCRRMVMSWDFYRAIQLPNVKLVTSNIDEVLPDGIRTMDVIHHPRDAIVLATGFHPRNYIRPIELTTSSGARLTEEWAVRPSAYLGIHLPKFPNFFIVGGPSSPLGNFSATAFTEAIADRILACLCLIRDKGIGRLEVTEKALKEYYSWLKSSMPGTIWVSGCESWYLDSEGFPSNNFPGTPELFRTMLKDLDLSKFHVESKQRREMLRERVPSAAHV